MREKGIPSRHSHCALQLHFIHPSPSHGRNQRYTMDSKHGDRRCIQQRRPQQLEASALGLKCGAARIAPPAHHAKVAATV